MIPGSLRRRTKPRRRKSESRTIVSISLGVFWTKGWTASRWVSCIYLCTWAYVLLICESISRSLQRAAVSRSDVDIEYHGRGAHYDLPSPYREPLPKQGFHPHLLSVPGVELEKEQ